MPSSHPLHAPLTAVANALTATRPPAMANTHAASGPSRPAQRPAWAAFALPRTLACGLLTGSLLAGCATVGQAPADWPASVPAPATLAQAATPTSATTGSTAPAPTYATWWTRFDDPVLTRLIEQALATHTDVRSAQAAVRQARATRDTAAAARLPSVGASASAQRSRSMGSTGTSATNGTTGTTTNLYAVGLDASWEADLFGQNARALDASEADARAAEWSLAQVHTTLAAEVALAYADWWGYRNRLAIAQANLQAQADSLQLTRWRVQAGLSSALEQAQGSTAVAQLQAQLPALQAGETLALHSLAVLTGQLPAPAANRPPAELSQALATNLQATLLNAAPAQALKPPTAPTLDESWALPADTLRQRPDVQRAAAQVEAAWARVGQADAARRPSVSLSGTLGFKALTLGALGGSETLVHTLLASLSAPLFDAGAGDAKVRAQQAAYDQSRAAYEAAVHTALKDVADTLTSLQADQTRLTHLQAAARSAAQADTLARQRYRSGLIDYATVLDTQRTLLSAQDSVASAQTTLLCDHVRLFKALGGGWSAERVAQATQATSR